MKKQVEGNKKEFTTWGETRGITWWNSAYLGYIDSSLLEGAVSSIVGTDVTIFTPMTRKGSIHTGQAAARKETMAI